LLPIGVAEDPSLPSKNIWIVDRPLAPSSFHDLDHSKQADERIELGPRLFWSRRTRSPPLIEHRYLE
jgi:hypothetical protein